MLVFISLSLFPELWSNKGYQHQNNTWVGALTVYHDSTYIILFLTWHSSLMIKKKRFPYWLCVPFMKAIAHCILGTNYYDTRADSSFTPSQWETALLCNNVSHWLGTNLESAMWHKHAESDIYLVRYEVHSLRYPWPDIKENTILITIAMDGVLFLYS